ncbi:MAG: TrmO family methyltransferase [Promethearchaeota archaeon]
MDNSQKEFNLKPVGYVRIEGDDPMDSEYFVDILAPYRVALKELDKFSHVLIFWWADKNDNKESRNILEIKPPYGEEAPSTGVFATRAEYRLNPIAITTANIIKVDQKKGFVKIPYIDAFDGSPVIDLKAYFPICDRVRDVHIAPWLKDWPDWFEDGATWWADQGFFED